MKKTNYAIPVTKINEYNRVLSFIILTTGNAHSIKNQVAP